MPWPNIPCPPGSTTTANDHLDYIRDKAILELAPGWMRNRILTAVEACRIGACHFSATPPPDPIHCDRVLLARSFAAEGNWGACANELEHGM